MSLSTDRRRDLDLVLYGATGFVGRLVAAHLATAAPPGLRVALAGRSRQRLALLQAELGPPAAAWPLIEADAQDSGALGELARSSRVVASAAGPYLRLGLPLLEACVAAGTDYTDLTGELPFLITSVRRHHDDAASAGARIVHSCGFDSLPSDIAVLVCAERAAADGTELGDTTLLVRYARGGFSGGTIASALEILAAAERDPQLRRDLADPYALSPDRVREPEAASGSESRAFGRAPHLGTWTGPFVMAAVNTRVVRRSNALLDWSYGRGFRYREVVATGAGPMGAVRAGALTTAMAAGGAALAFRPTRRLIARFLPSPGEGPDEQTRSRGGFRMDVHSDTPSGRRYRAVFAGRGDPGYAATAVMFGQSALCLALDRDRLPQRAGVLTPATAFGEVIVERLRANGFRIEVSEV